MYPIYIIGSERSGTNLVQRLISNHSKIDGPKSPHLINTFSDIYKFYKEDSLSDLFEDMQNIANHEFTGWDIKESYSEFCKTYEKGGLIEMISFLYERKVLQSGKSIYVSKELNAHNLFYELIRVNPSAKFIHLVRDPREQVASWMRTPLSFLNPRDAIYHWVRVQNEILNLQRLYPQIVYCLKYEDVVNDTRNTFVSLFQFLNLQIEEACLATRARNTGESLKVALWENLDKPIQKSRKKYQETLSIDQVRMIESIASEKMKFFDYEFDTDQNWTRTPLSRFNEKLYNRKSIKRRGYKGYSEIMDRINYAGRIKNDARSRFFNKKR